MRQFVSQFILTVWPVKKENNFLESQANDKYFKSVPKIKELS